MEKHAGISIVAWLVALIVSLGGLAGAWSTTTSNAILAIHFLTLSALCFNSFSILRWVSKRTENSKLRLIAWLSFASMLFCVGGDVVNFNLSQSYYRHSEVIKHDYLADSVLFFGLGYSLLLAAVVVAIQISGRCQNSYLLMIVLGSVIMASISFLSMHIPGTGIYVSLITAGYSLLISLVGLSGILLWAVYGGSDAAIGVKAVSAGLVLAMVADGVIGAFWIYGNNGEGFFPAVRDVNWIIYIASQALLIHLPKVLTKRSEGNSGQVIS